MKEIEDNRLTIGIREWAIEKSLAHFFPPLPDVEEILKLAKKYETFALTGKI